MPSYNGPIAKYYTERNQQVEPDNRAAQILALAKAAIDALKNKNAPQAMALLGSIRIHANHLLDIDKSLPPLPVGTLFKVLDNWKA